MLRLPSFRFLRARTLNEAAAILAGEGAAEGENVRLVAGGTDLWPNMKRRHQKATTVVSLMGIPGLSGIEANGEVHIGATALLDDVVRHPALRARYPAFAAAVQSISSPPLRNMGTIGGNLLLDTRCNYYDQNYEWRKAIDFCMKTDRQQICWVAPGSPKCLAVQSADTVPVLIAMGARAALASREGEREIAVEDLYRNDGIDYVTKRPDELLTEVLLPKPNGWRASYRKLRRRGAFDFPVLSVGAAVWMDGGVVTGARLVLGGVASAPIRLAAAEEVLRGRALDDRAIADAGAAAAGPSRPMDNTDFSFLWRKEMTKNFVRAALAALA